MRRPHSTPIFITLCFMAGIALGFLWCTNILVSSLLLCGAFATSLLAFIRTKYHFTQDKLFIISVGITLITLGFWVNQIYQPKHISQHYIHHLSAKKTNYKLKITSILKHNLYTDNYVAEVEEIHQQKVTGKILLSVFKDSTKQKFRVDDQLSVYGLMKDIYSPLNPFQFDYARYMANQNVLKQISLPSNHIFRLHRSSTSIFGRAGNLQRQVDQNLKQYNFSDQQIALMEALLLGQRSELTKENYDNFIDAGVVHILAVSGLHVGIIMSLLMIAFYPLIYLKNGRLFRGVLVVLLLWFYAILIGLTPSILRAVTMFTFLSVGLFARRQIFTLNMLCASAIFLLCFNPNLLLSVGFQLSYLAVLSIILFHKKILNLFDFKSKIFRYFWSICSVTLAAQLGVFPLSLFYFHQFPGLFFITNLLAIPGLGLILGVGILVLISASFFSVPDWLVLVYGKILDSLQFVIDWVAQQDEFIFRHVYFPIEFLGFSFLILTCLGFYIYRKKLKYLYLSLVAIVAFQIFILYDSAQNSQKKAVYVFHKSRHSILAYRSGKHLNLISDIDSFKLAESNLITGFKEQENIVKLTYREPENYYKFDKNKLFVIDSTAVWHLPKKTDNTYVLLRFSPRINLERMIDSIQPKQIVADGSNYRFLVSLWETTCAKKNVPFHYTGKQGAYQLELNTD